MIAVYRGPVSGFLSWCFFRNQIHELHFRVCPNPRLAFLCVPATLRETALLQGVLSWRPMRLERAGTLCVLWRAGERRLRGFDQ